MGRDRVPHIPVPCFDGSLWQGTEGGWRDALFTAAAWARGRGGGRSRSRELPDDEA